MKNRSLLLAGIMLSAAAGTAIGDGKIQIDTAPAGYRESGFNGGAFKITPLSGWSGVTGGQGGTSSTWLSFCLEAVEYISLPGDYWTTISTDSVKGGTTTSDPLGSIAAVMYHGFRNGLSMGGYTIDGTDATLTTALQWAIWKAEGEFGGSLSTVAQAMYDWAVEATDGDITGDIAGFQGGATGNVRVLQLWGDEARTVHKQDQFTMIPLPGTAGLASLGLLGIAFSRRRIV